MNSMTTTKPKKQSGWHRSNRVSTAEYRRNRQLVIIRDRGLCIYCEVIHNRITPFDEVDHWIPQAYGGDDDMNNLSCLCKPHHDLKTRHEAKDRIGFPFMVNPNTGYRIKPTDFAQIIRKRTADYNRSLFE